MNFEGFSEDDIKNSLLTGGGGGGDLEVFQKYI